MPNTFIKIASVTVGAGGAASIDFTSIPSTYTDLVLKLSLRSSASAFGDDVRIRFNSDTGSNYTYRRLYGNGSTAASDFSTGSTFADSFTVSNTATSNTFGNTEIYVPNYAGATNKSFSSDSVTENNATSSIAGLIANLWSNTAAITSINLTPFTGSTTFLQYSTATLYGIKNS